MSSTTSTQPDAQTQSKGIGPVTTAATSGATVAGAVSILIVWGLSAAHIEVPAEVGSAIATLCAGIGGLIGGYLAPSQRARVAEAVAANAPTAEEIAQRVAQVAPTLAPETVTTAVAEALPAPVHPAEIAQATAAALAHPTSTLHQQIADVAAVTARDAVAGLARDQATAAADAPAEAAPAEVPAGDPTDPTSDAYAATDPIQDPQAADYE